MNEVVNLSHFYCNICGEISFCGHIHEQSLDETSQISQTLRKVYNNLTNFGFIILRGYEIGNNQEVSTLMKSFFQQSLDMKLQFVSKDRARRGYSPLSAENFATLIGVSGKPNDTVEKYRIGPILNEVQKLENLEYFSSKEGRIHFFPNNLELFSETDQLNLSQYYISMQKLSILILNIIEIACNLSLNSFSSNILNHTSILSFNYYPEVPELTTGEERVAEHTDVSMFTIVSELANVTDDTTTSNSELQLCNLLTNEWESIHLANGDFAVNVGDCLKDWSRGLLKSALHRVVSKTFPVERITSAYFFSPNYNSLLSWPGDFDQSSEPVHYSKWRKQVIAKAMSSLNKNISRR